MPTDYGIRRMHVVEGWSRENIADMLGHSVDSVRGRISRASLADRVEIARELAESQPLINHGTERQKAVLRRAEKAFDNKQEELRLRGTMAVAVFVSDMHIPYTNWDAVLLTLEIIKDIQPDYISALNDLFDFEGYGRWDDNRSPAQQLWSDDITNALAVAAELHDAFHKAAPNATLIQVQGNHDNWMYNHIRTISRNGFAEHNIAAFMEELERQGVVQFVNGEHKRENIVQLSPGLKWVHGISASKNSQTVAKITNDALRGRDEDEGIFYYTVAGHTHRSHETAVNGVKHWNSGTLSNCDPRYMKHKPLWDTSIVINRYDPNSRFTLGDVVEYKRRGGHLIARYDGVTYDVPIKERETA